MGSDSCYEQSDPVNSFSQHTINPHMYNPQIEIKCRTGVNQNSVSNRGCKVVFVECSFGRDWFPVPFILIASEEASLCTKTHQPFQNDDSSVLTYANTTTKVTESLMAAPKWKQFGVERSAYLTRKHPCSPPHHIRMQVDLENQFQQVCFHCKGHQRCGVTT